MAKSVTSPILEFIPTWMMSPTSAYTGPTEPLPSMRPAIPGATVIVSDAAIRSCDWPAGRAAGAPCSPCRNAHAPRPSRSGQTARRTSGPCPVLLVRRIEDRLQQVHEPVRAADVQHHPFARHVLRNLWRYPNCKTCPYLVIYRNSFARLDRYRHSVADILVQCPGLLPAVDP